MRTFWSHFLTSRVAAEKSNAILTFKPLCVIRSCFINAMSSLNSPRICIYLSVCLSVCLSIYLSIYLSINTSIHLFKTSFSQHLPQLLPHFSPLFWSLPFPLEAFLNCLVIPSSPTIFKGGALKDGWSSVVGGVCWLTAFTLGVSGCLIHWGSLERFREDTVLFQSYNQEVIELLEKPRVAHRSSFCLITLSPSFPPFLLSFLSLNELDSNNNKNINSVGEEK